MTGEGRVAVRGSYGRYVGGSSGASANPGPGADRRQPERDHHADVFELGRPDSVRAGRREPDVDVGRRRQPLDRSGSQGTVVDEYTAGLDLGLSRVLTVQFNYVRKIDGNGNKSINLALPYDAYTVTTTGVDPGRDNAAGTADDQTLTVYSVPRTYPTSARTSSASCRRPATIAITRWASR